MKEDRTQTNAFETFRKSLIPAVFTVSCLLVPFTCFATDFAGTLDGVTITDAQGTNAPPTASFIYTVDGNTVTFDASGSSDSDGTIVSYTWDFGDGSKESGISTTHQFTDTVFPHVTLSLIDEKGAIAISQQSITGEEPINIAINFQPSTAEIPDGFQPDVGALYNDVQGFGWVTELIDHWPKDRNNPASPNQAYDTFMYIQPHDVWEIKVPNGEYTVTICIGEPSYPYGTHSVQIEDTPFITDTKLDGDNKWAEESGIATVTDGKLTITFKETASKCILTWVTINNAN